MLIYESYNISTKAKWAIYAKQNQMMIELTQHRLLKVWKFKEPKLSKSLQSQSQNVKHNVWSYLPTNIWKLRIINFWPKSMIKLDPKSNNTWMLPLKTKMRKLILVTVLFSMLRSNNFLSKRLQSFALKYGKQNQKVSTSLYKMTSNLVCRHWKANK